MDTKDEYTEDNTDDRRPSERGRQQARDEVMIE